MKALEILYSLNEAVSLSKNYPSDELLDEAIAELEALQQPKNCEGCVHLDRGRFCTLPSSNHCIRDAEDYFELKE